MILRLSVFITESNPPLFRVNDPEQIAQKVRHRLSFRHTLRRPRQHAFDIKERRDAKCYKHLGIGADP